MARSYLSLFPVVTRKTIFGIKTALSAMKTDNDFIATLGDSVANSFSFDYSIQLLHLTAL